MATTWMIAAAVVLVAVYAIVVFNRLIRQRNVVREGRVAAMYARSRSLKASSLAGAGARNPAATSADRSDSDRIASSAGRAGKMPSLNANSHACLISGCRLRSIELTST